jgi:uroporphyrin-III C-methyltransferase/precorrin-2 dehydrogenase/sirohydrochlorin ferrochelatase
MNTLYPIFMNVEHKPVLLIGGGSVAEQKIKSLLEAKADVTVLAPRMSEAIEHYAREQHVSLLRRKYVSGDVKGFFLAIGATNCRDVQISIFNDAQREHIPVNIVDVPDLCTFYLSSIFQKGDLTIAVSTNGKSPTLGKIIRDKIRDEFSQGYPELLNMLGGMRSHVLREFTGAKNRKRIFERMVHTELERLPLYTERSISQRKEHSGSNGKVFLIGAGPGDPELITIKGLNILRSADVVLYDALVNTDLLSYAPANSEKIYVGKRSGHHCIRQEEINELLISKAREGKCVVRLKGGDPMIFGHGGEEIEALQKEGVEVVAVPGITAGIGVPTSLGLPLTHRRDSSSVVFVTGHEDPAKNQECVDWQSVSCMDTIVIYMGVKRLHVVVEQLMRNGVPPSRPVAVIFNGTQPGETVMTGILENIEERVQGCSLDSPGLIVVGDVVRFLDRPIRHNDNLHVMEIMNPEHSL